MDTDAQMARLLEIHMTPHPIFTRSTEVGRKMYNFTTTCYGVAGEIYIKHLVSLGDTAIRAMIAEHIDKFKEIYSPNFSGQERFREQAIVLADLGNRIAQSLGLIQYDPEVATRFILGQLSSLTDAATSIKMDCFDILAQYMNDNAGEQITIMHTAGQKPTYDYTRLPRSGIRIRVDVYRSSPGGNFTHGTIMLDKVHFRTWLAANRHDIDQVCEAFVKAGVEATPKSKKFSIGRDTPIKIGQVYVIGLTLNHDRLQGILNDADDSVDNLTFGQLQAVV
jgi:hypothetical protein